MLKKLLFSLFFLCQLLETKAQLCLYSAATLTCPSNPTCLVSGDFNNDSKLDLALGSQTGITILQGNGDGTFLTMSGIILSQVRSLATADFNLDGNLDLVALQEFGLAKVLIGSGSSTFTFSPGGYPGCSHPLSVLTDDFNNDNKPDLVVTNFCAPYFHRYFGDGTGGFVTGTMFTVNGGNNCFDGTSADFNSDGFKDLALTSLGSNDVSVFLAQSSGSFSAVVKYPVGTWPESLSSADFNNDGIIDIAAAISGSDSVAVMFGSTNGVFGTPTNYKVGLNPKYIISKDMNGDGKADILTSNYNSGSNNVAILLNSNGSFLPAIYFSVGANPLELIANDFNGDTKPDLIVCNKSSNSLSIWLSSFPAINGPTTTCLGSAITLTASFAGVTSFTWNAGVVSPTISLTPQTNTNYVVAVNNTLASCTASTMISVKVKPLPVLNVTSSNSISCKGEPVTITVSGANTYTWAIGSNNTFVIANLSSSFNYSISGTDSVGCTNKTIFTQSVNACTAINALPSASTELYFYPNPSNGKIQINYGDLDPDLKVRIQNLCGQIIYYEPLSDSKEIDLLETPVGIYLISFMTDEKNYGQSKLVISR
jgi:hypothetical protein